MSSFLSRLKSNQPSSPSGLISPTKSKSNVPLSPIESILQDSRPLRSDGSDKFFGMHNPNNTCYCNSVLQCLYYSEPFRKHVISFPLQTVEPSNAQSSRPDLHLQTTGNDTIAGLTLVSPVQSTGESQHVPAPKSPLPTPSTSTVPPSTSTVGDTKESFDNRKKQLMAMGPHIRMESSYYEQYGMPESLYTGLKDIFEAIIADKWRMGVVVPSKFMETLRQKYGVYRSPQHQDAHEFLNLLLNEVVEQVEKYSKSITVSSATQIDESRGTMAPDSGPKTNPSWVHELFEGTLTSETRCLTCESISRRDEVFLDLSVDLEEHTSVTSCLRKFSQEEMLRERNKFHCDTCCGLQEAEKRMKIKRLPRILALHLKRFKYVEEVQRLQKLFHRVVFPFHLRLMNTTDDAEDPDRLYELYAIIVHLGASPFQGHYVSIIKTQDRGWLLFDDELVIPVDAEYVRNFFGGDPRNPACAYVLFYTQTTDEAMQKEQYAEDDLNDRATGHGREAMHPVNDPTGLPPTEIGAEEPLFSLDGLASRPLSSNIEQARGDASLQNPSNGDVPTQPRLSQTLEPRPIATPTTFSSDGAVQTQSQVRDFTQGIQDDKHTDKPVSRHSAMRSGALSRFRNTSLSLKTKPRLWGKPDRADSEEAVMDDSTGQPTVEEGRSEAEQPAIKSKAGRFGLGRKKSTNLLSRKE